MEINFDRMGWKKISTIIDLYAVQLSRSAPGHLQVALSGGDGARILDMRAALAASRATGRTGKPARFSLGLECRESSAVGGDPQLEITDFLGKEADHLH